MLATTAQVVRESAVASTFAILDGVAQAGLADPPDDTGAEALREWSMGLASFGGDDGQELTPTQRERRMTLIARDGTVLADSHENARTMDNHRDRPEIMAAFASGYGRSQRFSDTRGEELSYVAVQLPWSEDTVLRLSEPGHPARRNRERDPDSGGRGDAPGLLCGCWSFLLVFGPLRRARGAALSVLGTGRPG